jgi:hypothetical protein
MELTDAQKQTVKQWVKDGCGLSEIQKRISEELGVSMTYMDVRFLVIDLGVAVKDKQPSRSGAAADLGSAAAGSSAQPDLEEDLVGGPSQGGVSVDVDRVQKAGSLVSGQVVFSDGVKASWSLDQFGRLAIEGARPGYRPSQEDLAAFQEKLRAALERQGY